MKKWSFLCLLALAFFFQASAQVKNPNTKVLAYYLGGPDALDNYDVSQMTHIIFCFGAQLDGNKYKLRNARDTATIKKMVSLKTKNPNLKVLISLGGAGGCLTCSSAFSTEKGRKEFASSVKEHLQYFGADGIDLDWEFPGFQQNARMEYSANDVKNFTLLVKELKAMGPKYQVTFAVGGHRGIFEERTDYKEVMKYADFVNLMTYELMVYPESDTITNYAARKAQQPNDMRPNPHHVPLYSTAQQERSVDFCVKYLLKLGIPANKIVVGAAFYGIVFSANDTNDGLYKPGKRLRPPGTTFKDLDRTLSPDSGWVKHWDDVAKVPYAYNKSKQQFITYEDKRSIDLKMKYVIDHKLGGIMFWQLGGDSYKDGLLNTIDQVKNTYTGKK